MIGRALVHGDRPRTVVSVVGARPNLMKAAPVARALAASPDTTHHIVHTGQHYDPAMSDAFFRELELSEPYANLDVGSGSHAYQTATVMLRLEPVLERLRPDLVLVYGDVNSTLAATVVCAKLGVRTGHVEAGLRSHDRTMPEEINRLLTDRAADLLFAPSRDAVANLLDEGTPRGRIHFVGNVMIDTLVDQLPYALECDVLDRLGLAAGGYTLVTLHRPSNVDDPERLRDLVDALATISCREPVVFPAHPRTRERLERLAPPARLGSIRLVEPQAYRAMLRLVTSAGVVITDSGGLQEETTYLGVPCLTVRPNTERPITCTEGTNRLVPPRGDALLAAYRGARWRRRARTRIDGWDGRAGERIAAVITGARSAAPKEAVLQT